MAIYPQRRENLLEQATAFHRRLLLRLPVATAWQAVPQLNAIASQWCSSFADHSHWELFLGSRLHGGWSLYYDIEPVLQFNLQGQLRRLYAGGQRYAADQGRLRLMQQPRKGGRIQFNSSCVDTTQTQLIYETCLLFLKTTAEQLFEEQYSVVGQFPSSDIKLVVEAQQLVAELASGFAIAAAAN